MKKSVLNHLKVQEEFQKNQTLLDQLDYEADVVRKRVNPTKKKVSLIDQ